MPATDAVTATAVARREARASLDRMEYHLARGARGVRGVEREVRFLDALHNATVRATGAAVGVTASATAQVPLGRKAVTSLAGGSSAQIGRMKSSILADFSADALQVPREQAASLGFWKWTANASACPSCLDRHGRSYSGHFIPLHPSCLCIPQPTDTPGLRPLSDAELVGMAEQYGNPRYARKLDQFRSGDISRAQLSGVEAVNTAPEGLAAVAEHLAKGEVSGLPGGIADDIVKKTAADPKVDVSTSDFWQDADGVWDPERVALHDDIVKQFLDADASDLKTFDMMGGGPASGKSTMLESDALTVPKGKQAVQIDPDEIKKFLPEYADMTAAGDLNAAAFAHEESSYLSKRILKEASEANRSSIVLDGTGDKGVDGVAKKVQAAKDQGYRVRANYATNDTELAWRLAQERAEKTGRHVPESVVRGTHADVSDTFIDALARNLFDDATLWDTNIYKKPRLVMEAHDGVITIADEELLANFLAKSGTRTVDDVKRLLGLTDDSRPWAYADDELRIGGIGDPIESALMKKAEAWAETLTLEERAAVEAYTRGGYSPVNQFLLTGDDRVFQDLVSGLDGEKLIADIRSALGKWDGDEVTSFRKIKTRGAENLIDDLDAAFATEGVFEHVPFASSSMRPDFTLGGDVVRLEIRSKSGAYVRPISGYGDEAEWLIADNTKFRVVGKREVEYFELNADEYRLSKQFTNIDSFLHAMRNPESIIRENIERKGFIKTHTVYQLEEVY